jgi:hypothetical protein
LFTLPRLQVPGDITQGTVVLACGGDTCLGQLELLRGHSLFARTLLVLVTNAVHAYKIEGVYFYTLVFLGEHGLYSYFYYFIFTGNTESDFPIGRFLNACQ